MIFLNAKLCIQSIYQQQQKLFFPLIGLWQMDQIFPLDIFSQTPFP